MERIAIGTYTEDLLLLATATVKSVKRCHTITELVVVWSVCSICTGVTKSKVVGPHIQLDTLQRFTLFALAVARSKKTSVLTSFAIETATMHVLLLHHV